MYSEDCWHMGWNPRIEDIREVPHLLVLKELIKDIRNLSTIDLGCGNQAVKPLFKSYVGVDLPWDIFEDDITFIKDYRTVLMNAFIDVLQYPIVGLTSVLKNASRYIILHRQEFTDHLTTVSQQDSYGGWTWHSKINRKEFAILIKFYHFSISKELSCGFDNWKDGGSSILLKKKL